jgi:hypothetical protein
MFNSTRTSNAAGPVAGLLLGAILVLVAACGAAAPSPAPASPAPSNPATPAPTEQPTEAPASEAPSPAPSEGAGDEPVVLDIPGGHVVSVVVTDRGVGLSGAESGKAGDGMSVRWGDAIVENVDPNTVKVTWVGFPQDETVGLVLEPKGDKVVIRFGQNAPYENTDALGADRVMVFAFDAPVSADDVVVEFTTADD